MQKFHNSYVGGISPVFINGIILVGLNHLFHWVDLTEWDKSSSNNIFQFSSIFLYWLHLSCFYLAGDSGTPIGAGCTRFAFVITPKFWVLHKLSMVVVKRLVCFHVCFCCLHIRDCLLSDLVIDGCPCPPLPNPFL